MPLYRGFFFNKKGPAIPEPVEQTRRIARTDPVKVRPTAPSPTAPSPTAPSPTAPSPTAPSPTAPTAPSPTAPSPTAPSAARPAASSANESLNALSSPVVGWLAIIAGPGRGEVLRLGYGVNDIGSGPSARVRLNFGDPAIAPENHAAILYTTRSRRFYLAQSADSETRLNGQPVWESVELTGGDTMEFGQTQVRFVPLCGPGFDWRDGN